MQNHAQLPATPRARLHREMVEMLRAAGSVEGAERVWDRAKLNDQLWHKIRRFALSPHKRRVLNRIAFPDCNFVEVDAALVAGNSLAQLSELASGLAAIARDATGQYKRGHTGFSIAKYAVSPKR
jgi:hypothetical protein